MDQATFLEDCLDAHHDLLALERRVHEWICGLAGLEVVAEPGEPLPWQRPGWEEARAAPAAPAAPAEEVFDPALFEPAPEPAPESVAGPAADLAQPLWPEEGTEDAWAPEGKAEEPARMARENRPPRPPREQDEPHGRHEKHVRHAETDADNPWAG